MPFNGWHELIIEFLTPRLQLFFAYTVRQYVLTKLGERNILSPRLFTPYLECPFYITHQIAGINIGIFLPADFTYTRRAIQAESGIHRLLVTVATGSKQSVGRIQPAHVGTVHPRMITQIVYQEKGCRVLQAVSFIHFQHSFQTGIGFQYGRPDLFHIIVISLFRQA